MSKWGLQNYSAALCHKVHTQLNTKDNSLTDNSLYTNSLRTALSVKSTASVSEIKLLGLNVILVFEENFLWERSWCICTLLVYYLIPNHKDNIYIVQTLSIWFTYDLFEFFSSAILYTEDIQVVIFLFSLNIPNFLLPQDLCTCCSFFSL